MTTIFTDGNYIVADRLSTCSRNVYTRHAEGGGAPALYRFGIDDAVKIAKIKGLKIDSDTVKAVAIAGSAGDAGDFLRDLRGYIKAVTSEEDRFCELRGFLKLRGVFKIPFTGNFSILFLTESKQALVLRVSASTKKVRSADDVPYATEMIRVKKHDLSGGMSGLIGLGSGSVFYTELGPFLRHQGEQPHILDVYCYCVNRDYQHSSENFSVYSLELDHIDEKVEFPTGEFEARMNRFLKKLDFTQKVYGSLSIATRVSEDGHS